MYQNVYFSLQHPQFHDLDSKAVRCFCAEDVKTMQRWVVGIRLAKVGNLVTWLRFGYFQNEWARHIFLLFTLFFNLTMLILLCYFTMFLQFGYKMLLDYTDTQEEMDKLAFSLDRVTFTRASSFSAGENVESPTNKTQVGLKSQKLYVLKSVLTLSSQMTKHGVIGSLHVA